MRRGLKDLKRSSVGVLALSRALAELARVRRTDAMVHLHGETGTGKELVANALHQGGLRADKAFMVQGCGGMNEALSRSVLFGQARGTLSGLERDRLGALRDADHGTLFSTSSRSWRPRCRPLLEALQTGQVTPVGGTKAERFDVRLVTGSQKDLKNEANAGRFREDLFQLLAGVSVRLPSLRQRGGDVLVLAQHFLDLAAERYGKDLKGFSTEAMQALENYSWPGNVRELENEIERVAIWLTKIPMSGCSCSHPTLPPRHLALSAMVFRFI